MTEPVAGASESKDVLGIDAGLPESSEGWPANLLERLKSVHQGDVLPSMPLLYLADPSAPVWDRTSDFRDGTEHVIPIVSHESDHPPYYMITSQTCDIVESAADRPSFPWIQASPVFNMASSLNGGERNLLSKRAWRRWLWYLPALVDGFWVADLRIEVPIEKGVLGSAPLRPGHLDEIDRQRLGQRLAQRRSRPAFSDSFVAVVQGPLVRALRDLKNLNDSLYAQMIVDVEVVARLDDHLAPTRVQVALICEGGPDPEVHAWWDGWWDSAHRPAAEAGINLLPPMYFDSAIMSILELRQFTTVPLDRVSPD